MVHARSEHRCAQDQLPPRCGGFSPRNSAEAVVEAVGFVPQSQTDRGEIAVGEEVDGDADVTAVCVGSDSVCLVNR